jgi:hypothetical protein
MDNNITIEHEKRRYADQYMGQEGSQGRRRQREHHGQGLLGRRRLDCAGDYSSPSVKNTLFCEKHPLFCEKHSLL